jgi:hypothetical protein
LPPSPKHRSGCGGPTATSGWDDVTLHVQDDKIGTTRPTDSSDTGAHHVSMPGSTPGTRWRAPSLTVLRSEPGRRGTLLPEDEPRASTERPSLHLVHNADPLLVAGADAARRTALLDDLIETMPAGTRFEEASTLSEVLERASASRIVVLSGGLEDASADSLMRVLGQRHPTLPIINMDPAGLDAP